MKYKLLSATVAAACLTAIACGSAATNVEPGDVGGQVSSSTTPSATDKANESTRLWIKPDLVDCEGSAPQTCMQIAESENGEYEYFYDQIEGFEFAEGTSYVVDVVIETVEDPPADGSSLRYTLVEIIEEVTDDEEASAGTTTTVGTSPTTETTTTTDKSTSTTDKSTAETVRLWIGPEQLDCVGLVPQTCLLVSTSETGEPELFYDSIEGFDPQPGTSYVVDASVEQIDNPPADASSVKYTLIKIIEESAA